MSDVERALVQLAGDQDDSPVPDLAGPVAARLRARPSHRTARARRRIAIVVVLALAVPAGAVAAVPPVRDAVRDALGIPGVRIERTTGPVRAPVGQTLDLGRRIAPGSAAGVVEFEPVGADALLGAPDEAYARALPPGRALTLVYATPGGPRLLLTEFRGSVAPDLVGKLARPGTVVERVRVNGERGAWLTGRPHEIGFLDARGRLRIDALRIAGDTLLWQRGPLTLRLEGAASREAALEVARAVG